MKRCSLLVLICLVANAWCGALDRNAFTVTEYHLNVMVDRGTHVMTAEGKLNLRNDSTVPQKNVSLQISSSLAWDRITQNDIALEYLAESYTSDIDHSGALSEAIITLPEFVQPGSTVTLAVQYGGIITTDGTRFVRMGAPRELAWRTDWDQIGDPFTAVRGLGHVVWYPVSIEAVSMSDGTAVSDGIARWKERHRNSVFDAKIVADMDAGTPLAVVTNAPGSDLGGKESLQRNRDGRNEMVTFATNRLQLPSMGTLTPAFAVGAFEKLSRPTVDIFYTPEHSLIAKDYAIAAEANDPLLNDWLPQSGAQPLRVVELSTPDANPYQDGAALFTPLRSSTQLNLQLLLLPTQVTARLPAARSWIQNGLGLFLQAVVNREQGGRAGALKFLDQYHGALAKAEELSHAAAHTSGSKPSSESDNTLLNTTDELYLRVKSGFVFWMLNDMLGDQTLQHALAAYRADADKDATYFQKLLQAQSKRNLEWFFDDWVYRDRGLPDFRVESASSRKLLSGNASSYQVTAIIENRGRAGAEVPVSFQTATGGKSVRVLVKAHDKGVGRGELPELPARVTVNDGSVPESDATNNVYEFAITQQP